MKRLAMVMLLGACAAEAAPADRRWVERASQLLRAGQLPSAAESARWTGKEQDAVLGELMADPAFGNAALDFGLYVLGARPQSLRPMDYNWQGNVYAEAVYSHPSAIHAAREALTDGNVLSLLEMDQPLYVAPIARYEDEDRGDEILKAEFESAFALFAPESGGTVAESCSTLLERALDDRVKEVLSDARFQETIADGLRMALRADVRKKCRNPQTTTKAAVLARLQAHYVKIEALYAYEAGQNRGNYRQKYVTDLRDAKDALPFLDFQSSLLTREGFWRTYVNSSTNYNRKRARYVLDRFFCDDLTPLDLPMPAPHGQGRHASDPACQSCHYRLDPMGGFFRYMGGVGRDREGQGYIDFDDMATFEDEKAEQYFAFWTEIGYIRDPNDPSRNLYGSNLRDLVGMLQTAPEVRQCLVRRLAEYVFGPKQAVDGAWLANAGAPLAAATPAESGKAFKETLKTLLTSNTFAQRNPDPETCYDFATEGGGSQVPCRIASVIERNCRSCHAGGGARAGLDLTAWVAGPDGEMTFKHKGLTRKESFERIRARLSTRDEDLIMPPRYMAPEDRIKFLSFLDRSEP